MLPLILVAAAGAAPDVLLVASPGLQVEAYVPWVHALQDEGATVTVVDFPCAGDLASLKGAVARAAAELPEGYVIAAHGLGATVALAAAPELAPSRWVLLGPVLDVWPVEVTRWLAERPVGSELQLRSASWEGHDLAALLLGRAEAPLGCFSPDLAREVQGWIRAAEVPLPLEQVTAPVWIGSGLLDAVAPPEALLPASRRLSEREVVRFGITRLDSTDHAHLDLIADGAPLRAAVTAALEGW